MKVQNDLGVTVSIDTSIPDQVLSVEANRLDYGDIDSYGCRGVEFLVHKKDGSTDYAYACAQVCGKQFQPHMGCISSMFYLSSEHDLPNRISWKEIRKLGHLRFGADVSPFALASRGIYDFKYFDATQERRKKIMSYLDFWGNRLNPFNAYETNEQELWYNFAEEVMTSFVALVEAIAKEDECKKIHADDGDCFFEYYESFNHQQTSATSCSSIRVEQCAKSGRMKAYVDNDGIIQPNDYASQPSVQIMYFDNEAEYKQYKERWERHKNHCKKLDCEYKIFFN